MDTSSNVVSSELMGIIHNVQLNDKHWWNTAIQSFILEYLYIKGSIEKNRIKDSMKEHKVLSLLALEEIYAELEKLKISDRVLFLDGKYILTEKIRKDIEDETKRIASISEHYNKKLEEVLLVLSDECKEYCTSDKINDFIDEMIFELGARVFNISIGTGIITETNAYDKFMQNIPESIKNDIHNSLLTLLDVNDKKIREYLNRKLNAFFCLKAGALTTKDVDRIKKLQKRKPEFVVFIDTNFLFSLLGLHENPANEVASSLIEIIKRLSQDIDIKLYITQLTLKEAIKVLDRSVEELTRIRFSGNIIRSVEDYTFNGIIQKWLNVVKEAKNDISISDYFEPYRKKLLSIVREYGIELYNEQRIEALSTDPDVLSDIALQIEHDEKRGRKKGYEQHLHDISIWYYINNLREKYCESIIDVKYWMVTVDNRYLAFDSFKKRQNKKEFNICVHPSVFFSMLQFWIPKNDDMEKILIEYIKQPVYFYDYDEKFEKETIRILQAISRFEDSEKIPVSIVSNMLTDNELRRRFSESESVDSDILLIKDELVQQFELIQSEMKEKENLIKEAELIRIRVESELELHARRIRELEEENSKLKEIQAISLLQDKTKSEYKIKKRKAFGHLLKSFFIVLFIIGINTIIYILVDMEILIKYCVTATSILGSFFLSLLDRNNLKSSFNTLFKDHKQETGIK